jgi:hypothetical protein
LREISDWDGFSDAQDSIRADARAWLVNQRKYIWRCAEGKIPDVQAGWDINQRRERYEQLKDERLNTSECRRVCQLPTNGCTPNEKAGITEREMWWRVSSVDDRTHDWRQANADWATNRRKQVWHLAEDEGWDEAERELRYENLCVATKHGSPYAAWADSHNETTGEPKATGGKGARSKAVDWCESHVGVHENPDGSNRGSPQPSGWQNRVYGDDGVPWCACFAVCCAWDNGVTGTGTAGVWNNTDLAKRGQGIYKGYTTDPSKVHAGDHAFIDDDHTGVIVDRDTMATIEGNTSNSGSQWNGGSVVRKDRGPGYWTGYGIVNFSD